MPSSFRNSEREARKQEREGKKMNVVAFASEMCADIYAHLEGENFFPPRLIENTENSWHAKHFSS
jgi:hypothetical protein